jgi:TetR/AcrR family acrAB operon transcriptional repressor
MHLRTHWREMDASHFPNGQIWKFTYSFRQQPDHKEERSIMARRTKEEAQETRNALLDAAEHVFSERGVSRTSLTDVAAAAGLTRGAVYWHFRDKADMLDAMLCRVVLPQEARAEREEMRCEDADPLVQLRGCLVGVLERTAADPQARRVFDIVYHKCEYIDEMAPARDRCITMRAGYVSEIERNLRDAVKLGLLPAKIRPRSAAVALHALVDGLIGNWVLDPKSFSLARDAGHMVDLFLNGLKSQTPQTRSTTAKGAIKRAAKAATKLTRGKSQPAARTA